jgi:predicted  nucleic acid-binding Zn-ribbon protein
MIPQSKALYNLQQIDLQLIHHRKRLKAIAAALGDNQVVADAQAQVDSAAQALVAPRTKVRDLELEIQSTNQKIKASDDKLYSGVVKNPKESQDLQNLLESLKRRKDTLEDRLLEAMIVVEEAEARVAECESQLQQVTDAWEQQHSDLIDEQGTLQAEIETLTQERVDAQGEVSAENLKLYDTMKASKANQPIAAIQERACGACGLEQTSATVQAVRHGQTLVKCEGCGRILTEG